MVGDKAPPVLPIVRIVQKNFVYDQRQTVPGAHSVQPKKLFSTDIRAGGIIRMNHHDRTRLLAYRLFQGMQVNLPSVVIEQRIRNQLHIFEIGQELKQGIARLRYKNFIAWIREQPKDVRISFASAGGEDQIFWRDALSALVIVLHDGFTRAQKSLGLRIVLEQLFVL